jgi:hypothetical protein
LISCGQACENYEPISVVCDIEEYADNVGHCRRRSFVILKFFGLREELLYGLCFRLHADVRKGISGELRIRYMESVWLSRILDLLF